MVWGSDCLLLRRADGIFERTKPRALPWAGILRAVGAMKMANSQLDFVSELENQDTSRLLKKSSPPASPAVNCSENRRFSFLGSLFIRSWWSVRSSRVPSVIPTEVEGSRLVLRAQGTTSAKPARSAVRSMVPCAPQMVRDPSTPLGMTGWEPLRKEKSRSLNERGEQSPELRFLG